MGCSPGTRIALSALFALQWYGDTDCPHSTDEDTEAERQSDSPLSNTCRKQSNPTRTLASVLGPRSSPLCFPNVTCLAWALPRWGHLLSLSPFLDDHRYSGAVTRERGAASSCLTFGSTQTGAAFMGLLINTVLLLTQGSIGSKTQIGQDDTVKKIWEQSHPWKWAPNGSGKFHQLYTFPIIPQHLCQQVHSLKISQNKALLFTNGRGVGSLPARSSAQQTGGQPQRLRTAEPESRIWIRRGGHLKIRKGGWGGGVNPQNWFHHNVSKFAK